MEMVPASSFVLERQLHECCFSEKPSKKSNTHCVPHAFYQIRSLFPQYLRIHCIVRIPTSLRGRLPTFSPGFFPPPSPLTFKTLGNKLQLLQELTKFIPSYFPSQEL